MGKKKNTYIRRRDLDTANVGVDDGWVVTDGFDKQGSDVVGLESLDQFLSPFLCSVAAVENADLSASCEPLDHVVETGVGNLHPEVCCCFVG
jgi:hypothetical protein